MDGDDQMLCTYVLVFFLIVGLGAGALLGWLFGYGAGFGTGDLDLQKKWDVRHGMTPFEYHAIEAQKESVNKTYLSGYEAGYTDGFQAGFNKGDVKQ